ncbi:MAG: FadR family transcriptional regulator [Pirellulales bacterium]|nr:FadR family transcriptional regulator [Pirellulales bacterium]
MNGPPKRPLRRKRLGEELTAQLRKYIIEKGLKPGDPLLTEQEMVERFGVSRTVVREATKALDFLGVIGATPRRGMVIDDFDFSRVSEYFGFHFALSDYPRESLLKARAVIETGSLYYTMETMRADEAVYRQLRALAESAPPTDRLDDRWIEYDIAFHRGLVEASDITPLASFCDLLQAFFREYRDRTVCGDVRGGKKGHCQIVEALHEGKLDDAVALLRRHLGWYEEHDR